MPDVDLLTNSNKSQGAKWKHYGLAYHQRKSVSVADLNKFPVSRQNRQSQRTNLVNLATRLIEGHERVGLYGGRREEISLKKCKSIVSTLGKLKVEVLESCKNP